MCREINEIFNPSLHESFKFQRLARWILTPYRNAVKLLDLLYGRGGKAGIGISINPSLFWRNQQPKRVLHGYHIPLQCFFGARKVIHCDFGFDDHEPTVRSADYNVWLERHSDFPILTLAGCGRLVGNGVVFAGESDHRPTARKSRDEITSNNDEFT